MKNLTLLLIIIVLISCQETKKYDSDYQNIEIEKLNPNPILQESLSKQQLERIKKIHETFLEVYPISLDETIMNFKRDQNPDREIEVWQAMAESYQVFYSKNIGSDKLAKRKEGFALILLRSMMSEKEAVERAKLKILTEEEVGEILNSYDLGKRPIKIKTH